MTEPLFTPEDVELVRHWRDIDDPTDRLVFDDQMTSLSNRLQQWLDQQTTAVSVECEEHIPNSTCRRCRHAAHAVLGPHFHRFNGPLYLYAL